MLDLEGKDDNEIIPLDMEFRVFYRRYNNGRTEAEFAQRWNYVFDTEIQRWGKTVATLKKMYETGVFQ